MRETEPHPGIFRPIMRSVNEMLLLSDAIGKVGQTNKGYHEYVTSKIDVKPLCCSIYNTSFANTLYICKHQINPSHAGPGYIRDRQSLGMAETRQIGRIHSKVQLLN